MTPYATRRSGWSTPRACGPRHRPAYLSLGGGAETPDETPDANTLLNSARRALEAQSTVDPSLGDLAGRLAEASTLVTDIVAELSGYLAALEADPDRLATIYERRAALRASRCNTPRMSMG